MGGGKSFLSVRVEGGDNLKRFPMELSTQMSDAMKLASEKTAQDLKDSLEASVGRWDGEVGWTGYLYNSIEPRNFEWNNKSNQYIETKWGVVMLDYGWELDRGSTGDTLIKPGTKLATWASAHNLYGITAGPQSRRWENVEINVKPHPFIELGRANFKLYLDNALNDKVGRI